MLKANESRHALELQALGRKRFVRKSNTSFQLMHSIALSCSCACDGIDQCIHTTFKVKGVVVPLLPSLKRSRYITLRKKEVNDINEVSTTAS